MRGVATLNTSVHLGVWIPASKIGRNERGRKKSLVGFPRVIIRDATRNLITPSWGSTVVTTVLRSLATRSITDAVTMAGPSSTAARLCAL